jgi:ubiquinone/menaquinone biosynthesis C-methylase UbiE
MVGIDLSSRAIAFCHRTNLKRNIAYAEGDAEHIPFGAERFDVVTSVESSHNYPNIHAFYESVMRVLKPGGFFLYTDVIRTSVLGAHSRFLQELGFQLELDRDITENVLASCDEIATERQAVFSADHDAEMVRYILGSPGSGVYADLQSGRSTYRLLRLRKA